MPKTKTTHEAGKDCPNNPGEAWSVNHGEDGACQCDLCGEPVDTCEIHPKTKRRPWRILSNKTWHLGPEPGCSIVKILRVADSTNGTIWTETARKQHAEHVLDCVNAYARTEDPAGLKDILALATQAVGSACWARMSGNKYLAKTLDDLAAAIRNYRKRDGK